MDTLRVNVSIYTWDLLLNLDLRWNCFYNFATKQSTVISCEMALLRLLLTLLRLRNLLLIADLSICEDHLSDFSISYLVKLKYCLFFHW